MTDEEGTQLATRREFVKKAALGAAVVVGGARWPPALVLPDLPDLPELALDLPDLLDLRDLLGLPDLPDLRSCCAAARGGGAGRHRGSPPSGTMKLTWLSLGLVVQVPQPPSLPLTRAPKC